MEDNALNRYLDEIGHSSMLTDEEERELSRKIHEGDERALARLVESNLKFVVTIARQYKGHGVSMEDLVSEGNIGLMKAATKFREIRRRPCAEPDGEGHRSAGRTLSGAEGCGRRTGSPSAEQGFVG